MCSQKPAFQQRGYNMVMRRQVNILKSYSPNTGIFNFCCNNHQLLFCVTAPTFAYLFSTYIALINLNCSGKILSPWCDHGSSELMKIDPRCPITAQSDDSFKLHRTCTILLTGHPQDCSKPKCQRFIRAMKNRPRDNRSLVITTSTLKQNGIYGLRPI